MVAFAGPLQTGHGVLLADEVGLGKTVEALARVEPAMRER
jgi:hypothetical protein